MKLEEIFTPAELASINDGTYDIANAVLAAKLNLCAALEREACAKLCDGVVMDRVFNASNEYQNGRDMGATVCAAAIRARGEK